MQKRALGDQDAWRSRPADELVRREEYRVLACHIDRQVRPRRRVVEAGQRAVIVQQARRAVDVGDDPGYVRGSREAADLQGPVRIRRRFVLEVVEIRTAVGVLADRDDVRGRLSPRQLVRVMLERANEYGARVCGLAGYFDTAIALSRSGLEASAAIPPELQARLEAELIGDAWFHAATVPEARERARRLAASPPPLRLWRVNAAWESANDARPASEALLPLTAALDAGALDDDPDSILGTAATVLLIAGGEFDATRLRCAALIDLARARGWLIALAHGCFLRAMALVQAGEIRDAEADARLALEIKLTHSPPQR